MIVLIAKSCGFVLPAKTDIIEPSEDDENYTSRDKPFFMFHLPASRIIKSALAPDGFSVSVSSQPDKKYYILTPLRGADLLIPNIFGRPSMWFDRNGFQLCVEWLFKCDFTFLLFPEKGIAPSTLTGYPVKPGSTETIRKSINHSHSK